MIVTLTIYFSVREKIVTSARVQFESVHKAERSAAHPANWERRLCYSIVIVALAFRSVEAMFPARYS